MATLNIVLGLPDTPCTLNATVDDVAFTPATTPSSNIVPVAKVVLLKNLAKNPGAPPVTPPPENPSVDVATQRVDVPVA